MKGAVSWMPSAMRLMAASAERTAWSPVGHLLGGLAREVLHLAAPACPTCWPAGHQARHHLRRLREPTAMRPPAWRAVASTEAAISSTVAALWSTPSRRSLERAATTSMARCHLLGERRRCRTPSRPAARSRRDEARLAFSRSPMPPTVVSTLRASDSALRATASICAGDRRHGGRRALRVAELALDAWRTDWLTLLYSSAVVARSSLLVRTSRITSFTRSPMRFTLAASAPTSSVELIARPSG